MATRLEAHLAAVAATCALGPACSHAAIVHSGIVNINIPSSVDGVYLNVVTGVTGSSGTTTPGWDVNPWSATGLGFFSPAAPPGGAYVVTAPGFVQNLGIDFHVGPANQYGSGTPANVGMWNLNSSLNVIGFRFQNEFNANQIHYGWLRFSLGDSAIAQPRTIIEYAYESTAGVGISPFIPSPGSAGMLLMTLASAAGRRRRHER